MKYLLTFILSATVCMGPLQAFHTDTALNAPKHQCDDNDDKKGEPEPIPLEG